MLSVCKVTGHSMSPSYREGDYVLSVNSRWIKPQAGDCIVFTNRLHGLLLKKIARETDDGFFVEGTHPLSTNSRSIGLVTRDMIVGKVVMRFPRSHNRQSSKSPVKRSG